MFTQKKICDEREMSNEIDESDIFSANESLIVTAVVNQIK